jgi:hypothetical protein
VTHRLAVAWPDPRPFRGRTGPIRLLAVSDDADPTLEHETNRRALLPLDAIVSCGDLDPGWLAFLGDAFSVPLVRVLGNHDRDHPELGDVLPAPIRAGVVRDLPIPVVGLSWAGVPPARGDGAAWRQAVGVWGRTMLRRGPFIVASHVPPAGAGDGPDPYHHGYDGYRWLLGRLRPPLWLHGHTTLASTADWRASVGQTLVVNVTNSVLVELLPPGADTGSRGEPGPAA